MKVHVLRGLPGSGKSTFVNVLKENIKQKNPLCTILVVNRDEVRKGFIEDCKAGREGDYWKDYAKRMWSKDKDGGYQCSFSDSYTNLKVLEKFQDLCESTYYEDVQVVSDLIVDCTMLNSYDVIWLNNWYSHRWDDDGHAWFFYQLETQFETTHEVPEWVMEDFKRRKRETQEIWNKIGLRKNKFFVK